MTPADAAAILGVTLEASPAEIDAAYKRRARASHPDQFAGAGPEQTRKAADEFIRVTDARSLLSRYAAEHATQQDRPRRPPTVIITTPVSGEQILRRAAAPVSTIVWGYLLVFASVFAFVGGALPFSPWMLLVLIPTDVAAIAYARTGSRPLMIATLLLGAANAAVTIAFASFGALLAFEVLLAPGIALFVLGQRTARRRLRVRR
ncbi:J domain-containing protein [Lacisediminihabitans changchengi]|uniref:J domain-containing protein n=1 Tax=Lacisediminihabitans changchengi TaxID=2787634 RepID=A0A934W477_9MICO|nr:J domain-containing protein [Lacisediminihabitans changchengi]MBK4347220.1 J domain-containing protein [Lacisediminihabitans changchengi]